MNILLKVNVRADIKNKLVVTSSEREVGRGNISLGH